MLRTDDRTQLFDVVTLQERLTITNTPSWDDKVLISADGTVLALADTSQITLWDASTGRMKETIPIRQRPIGTSAFAVSPDWSTFLTCDSQSLFLWDRATRSLARELPGHDGTAYSASFSPDGRWFATGGWLDRKIKLWKAEAKEMAAVFTNHNGWIGRMDFSPDGTTLASCGSDHTIRLWDLDELKEKAVLRGHADEAWLVSFSADGRLLVSGDRGGEVSLWNTRPPSPEPVFLKGDFIAGAFASDSQSFTTLSPQGTIQTWDAATLREIRRASVPSGNPASARIGPDGSVLAMGRAYDRLWHSLRARIAPDGSVLAMGLGNGQIQLHNLTNPKLMPVLRHGPQHAVQDLEFSADGRRLASATALDLQVWDITTGASLYHAANLADSFWGLTPVALSPDGRVLAFATADLGLCIVDLETRSKRRITADLWGIVMLAFSPNGQYLAGAGRDHRIKIWQSSDHQEIATLKSWRQAATAIAFNPSSRRLAVALDEGGLKLFDLTTTQEVGWLLAKRAAGSVSFSPDGHSVVAQYANGFQFWRAPSWEQIASAETKMSRGFQQP
ncbi:MAG: WD40 repeat domain-containing protein [Acidobacteria bacterium]|nr:WD40 repeat domain-containing protein [Acidobacteriota bacterium]